jgi:competence ComEA-like helix-hairpin-helix protein
MKNYLSFGGGVNSVAMLLLFHELEIGHEAVYVWMPDAPETHDYLLMLEGRGFPITVIFPWVQSHWNLYNYCIAYEMTPSYIHRWCTDKFKVRTLSKYYQGPAFENIGFAADEAKRARLKVKKSIESRYPLIEYDIDRQGCIDIIKRHGLPVPVKSGCFFCCYQGVGQWKELRRRHPELFCKAVALEKLSMENARKGNVNLANERGLQLIPGIGPVLARNIIQHRHKHGPFDKIEDLLAVPGIGKAHLSEIRSYLNFKKHSGVLCNLGDRTIEQIINEKDAFLFEEMAYPPCECGL